MTQHLLGHRPRLTGAAVLALAGLLIAGAEAPDQATAAQGGTGLEPINFMTDAQVETLAAIAPAAGPVDAVTSPESAARFVKHLGDRAFAILRDARLPVEQRKHAMRALLAEGFAIGTIGRLVLGRYWEAATTAQRDEYLDLFGRFLVDIYTERFHRYREFSLEVLGARPSRRSLVVIESRVHAPGRGSMRIDWVVRPEPRGGRVIDLIVDGLSMALTQRYEFSGIIRKNDGDIEGLLAELRARTT